MHLLHFRVANVGGSSSCKCWKLPTILHFATGRHYKPIFMACCLPAKHEIHKQPHRAWLQRIRSHILAQYCHCSLARCNWMGGRGVWLVRVALGNSVNVVACVWLSGTLVALSVPGLWSGLPSTVAVVNNSLAQGHKGVPFRYNCHAHL